MRGSERERREGGKRERETHTHTERERENRRLIVNKISRILEILWMKRIDDTY